jgi:hypothetical protein
VRRKKSEFEPEVFMPVRDGHDVSGFTIARSRSAVVLRVHDWTEPLDEPIVTATLSAAEAVRLASWLRHFARLLVLALAMMGHEAQGTPLKTHVYCSDIDARALFQTPATYRVHLVQELFGGRPLDRLDRRGGPNDRNVPPSLTAAAQAGARRRGPSCVRAQSGRVATSVRPGCLDSGCGDRRPQSEPQADHPRPPISAGGGTVRGTPVQPLDEPAALRHVPGMRR